MDRRRKPIVPLTADQKKLVGDNVGLIGRMLRVAKIPDKHHEDFHQSAVFAMARAARSYDPGRGVKFSTYACRAILREFSSHKAREFRQTRGLVYTSATIDGRPTRLDIAAAVGTDPAELLSGAEQVNDLKRGFRKLDKRSREVLRRRFGMKGQPATLDEIGAELNISKERVRQIQQKALARLRESIAA